MSQSVLELAWEAHVAAPTAATRAELEELYLPLLHMVAAAIGRRLPRSEGLDHWDLVGWGFPGLAQAIDRFDPTRSASFATFATHRIAGAIRDGLRENDPWPRDARKRGLVPKRAPLPLDLEAPRPSETAGECERLLDLLPAASREREVLQLLYLQGLSPEAVGQWLEISPSRVSQLRTSGLNEIRRALGLPTARCRPKEVCP